MRQLRHQQLFSPKLPGLVMRKKRQSTIPTARRIDANMFLSNPQFKAKLEQALSSQMERLYAFIVKSKTRQRRVYRWCFGISTVLNIVAWVAFFIWVALPKQVAPIIDDDVVSVTFHSPDIPPEPIPRPPHTPAPLPKTREEEPTPPVEEPPEEPPVVSEEEADQPVVDRLDFDSLLDTAEYTRTQQDTKSEPIALDMLQQSLQDKEHSRVVETDLANLSPLQSKQVSVTRGGKQGSTASVLPISSLNQQGKGKSQKQHGINTALDLPDLKAEDENSEAKKQRTTGSALALQDLQAGRKSETSHQKSVEPAVEFRPLRGKGEDPMPFEIVPKPSKEDLKLQTLPELLTPIIPKFPPVQGIQTCTVVLWLWVETNGAPSEISVHKVSPLLDEMKERAFRLAAIEAVKVARFTPARLDGHPIRLLIEIHIWFDRSIQQSHP